MKISSYFLAILILSITSIVVFSQDTDVPTLVEHIVTADTANLRSEANTSSAIVGSVSNGESVFAYQEQEIDGWLQIYREGEDDAYIADFLVELAPLRFYSINQEPDFELFGRGQGISEVFDIAQGAYRIDLNVADRSIILEATVIDGDCRDQNLFNELQLNSRSLNISTMFIVQEDCLFIFESSNLTGTWTAEIRNLLDLEAMEDSAVDLNEQSSIFGEGRQLTMPTLLNEGVYSVSAIVMDQAFILTAEPIGNCDSGSLFNELDFNTNQLEVSTVYRANEDCIVWWQTDNVDGEWNLTFEKLR